MKKLLITFYDLVTVLVSDRKAGILWWLRARAVKCIPIFFPSFFFKIISSSSIMPQAVENAP